MATTTQADVDKLPSAPSYTVNSNQTVAGQLDGLLSQDNPLMKKAATKGMQYSNARGLLNSSIGAGAAQSAYMDYALPIAQADASIYNQFEGMKYGNELTQSNMALDQQNRLALQDDAQSFQSSESALDRTLTTSENELNREHDISKLEKADTLATDQLAKTTSANLQGSYVDAINEITKNAAVSINEIEIAEGITPDDKTTMINDTIERRDIDLAFAKELYSAMPTWDFTWIDYLDGDMPDAPGMTVPPPEETPA